MFCIVLCQYDLGRTVALIITISFISLVILIDLIFFSNKRQLKVFYIPLIVEEAILAIGVIVLIFKVPERWFKTNKFIQLYFTSYIIFSLFLISFIFELHSILYYTLKANSGYLDNDE
jgi:hypothetical protein